MDPGASRDDVVVLEHCLEVGFGMEVLYFPPRS